MTACVSAVGCMPLLDAALRRSHARVRNRQAAHEELFATTDVTNAPRLTPAGCSRSAQSAPGEERTSATRYPMRSAFDMGPPVSKENWNASFVGGISQRQRRA